MCAAALSQSQDKVIRQSAVNKLMSQWDFPPGAAVGYSPEVTDILVRLASVIQSLGYFGKDAKSAINDIESVFRNDLLYFEYEVPNKDSSWTKTSIELDHQRKRRSRAGMEVKRSAILSIFRIVGPERVLRLWDHVDPLGRATLLWLLGPVCANHKAIKEVFYSSPEYTQHIQQLVVESLESSSTMVRKVGIDELFFVFDDQMIVIRSPTDYELNPQIKDALENMAANDPDEQLRQRAASSLAQLHGRLDYAVKKILQKRKDNNESRGPQ